MNVIERNKHGVLRVVDVDATDRLLLMLLKSGYVRMVDDGKFIVPSYHETATYGLDQTLAIAMESIKVQLCAIEGRISEVRREECVMVRIQDEFLRLIKQEAT